MRYALRRRNFNKGKIQKHETASTLTYGYRRKIKNHHPFG